MRLVVAVVACLVGCVRTQTETCGDRVCPEGTTCAAYLDLVLCVSSAQTDACKELEEGERCEADGIGGFCHDGACLPIGCGNGRIDDPVFATDEECDDNNRVSHDGCSSTCKRETFSIDEQSEISLIAVTDHAMTFDESANTPILFGGAERNVTDSSRTWVLVEGRWRLLSTPIAPSPRHGHGMAYDSRRQVNVMYGGETGADSDGVKFGDTWEFDGTAWTSRVSTISPPPRQNHAMAYDPDRGVTLLFGGKQEGDTWSWDGVDWKELTFTRASPLARVHQAMAYDRARATMVLLIESADGVETYELDADGWRLVADVAAGPPRGSHTALAYDSVDRRILAHTDRGLDERTWSWDGTAWTSVATSSTIEQREDAAMAPGADGRVLRVGGKPTALMSAYADTARWNGTAWEVLPEPRFDESVPESRTDFSAAYDSDRHRVVLFGGVGASMGSTQLGDTWELGPGGWTRRPITGPGVHVGPAMAYDASRKRTVMFGDDTGGDARTWSWDGTSWTSLAPVAGLAARPFSAMAFDARRGVVVLFGGGDLTYLQDTWEFDGTTWTHMSPAKIPPPRSHHAMAYDPVRQVVVMFGGRNETVAFNDTWEWDGTNWRRAAESAVPTARFDHGLAWDPARKSLVLVGGREIDVFAAAIHDVWEFDGARWTGVPIVAPFDGQRIVAVSNFGWGTRALSPGGALVMATHVIGWSARTAYETCTDADHDRDGLVGCADPDCWAVCP